MLDVTFPLLRGDTERKQRKNCENKAATADADSRRHCGTSERHIVLQNCLNHKLVNNWRIQDANSLT